MADTSPIHVSATEAASITEQIYTGTTLEKLTQQGSDLRDLLLKKEQIEESLKEVESKINLLKSVVLPTIMRELRMSTFTLDDGTVFKLKEFLKAKIPDSKKEEAFAWLDQTGNGGIIKTTINAFLPRGQHEFANTIINDILSLGVEEVSKKEEVHPKTLESFVNEMAGKGELIPFDLFGVQQISAVTVTTK